MKFTYLTENEMAYFDQGQSKIVESHFLNKYRQSLLEIEKRKEWKQSTNLKMMGGLDFGSNQSRSQRETPFEFKGACFCQDEIAYTIQIEQVGGMFIADPQSKSKFEGHLAHYQDTKFGSIQFDSKRQSLLYSQSESHFEEHIFVRNLKTNEIEQLTEGDCIDNHPSFDRSGKNIIYYQSAGIGRDQNGNYWGKSPWAIYRYDENNSNVSEVLVDPIFDFILPKSLNGDLYFIQKPHALPKNRGPGFFSILSIPFKLGILIYKMIDFKNMQYTGKPLTGADSLARNDLDLGKLMIHGNLIDANKHIEKSRKRGDESPSIVPKDWQLNVLRPNGQIETISTGVIAFDIDIEGNIVYSNGTSVRLIDSKGNENILMKKVFVKYLSI